MTTEEVPTSSARIEQREQNPEFRIEIVYENPTAGAPALVMCEHLIEQFSDVLALSVGTHSFKAIEDELRAQECADSSADMIFVASAGTIPTAFVQWLNRCIKRSEEHAPIALVDMTMQATPNAELIHALLKRAAQVHHLDHFSKEHFEQPTTFTSSSLGAAPSRRVRHWGINE